MAGFAVHPRTRFVVDLSKPIGPVNGERHSSGVTSTILKASMTSPILMSL